MHLRRHFAVQLCHVDDVFLAFAIQAEKLGLTSKAQGKKGMYYLAGLAEGTETIAFFTFTILFPAAFAPAALLFAVFHLSVIGRLGGFSAIITSKIAGETNVITKRQDPNRRHRLGA